MPPLMHISEKLTEDAWKVYNCSAAQRGKVVAKAGIPKTFEVNKRTGFCQPSFLWILAV